MTINLPSILLHKGNGSQRKLNAPGSAAVHALYGPQSKRSHFYALSSRNMALLARVFNGVPLENTPEKTALDQLISSLPSCLRSSGMHRSPSQKTGLVHPGHLCDIHKDLKKALCYEIWDIVEHEVDAINVFTNPLLMSQELDANEKLRIHQLEHVPDLYTSGPDCRTCAVKPHGSCVPKYVYVKTQCPACMLATLGSGPEALVALLAGMIARVSSKQLGTREKLISRRAKLVTCWLQSMQRGSRLTDEAWTLGIKMKEIRWLHKARKAPRANSVRHGKPLPPIPTSPSISAASLIGYHGHYPYQKSLPARSSAREMTPRSAIGIDISDSFDPTSARRPSEELNPPSPVSSIVDVDISRPFNPTSDRKYSTPPSQASSSTIGFDISDPFDPATTNRHPQIFTPNTTQRLSQASTVCSETSSYVSAAVPDRASTTLSDAYRSICRRPSIASSFDSDWDWDRPVSPLLAVPVLTGADIADRFADVSPPSTPRG